MPNLSGTSRSGTTWTMTGGNVSKTGGLTRKNWRISGIQETTAGINAQLMRIQGLSAAGLLEAARMVLNDADSYTPPLVPEDEGTLRASQFQHARKKPSSGDPYVELGYSANYAAAVHEMTDKAIGKPVNWNRPQSGPKFLERSLARNADKIIQVVKAHIQ
jgi:hypothetical protein